MSAEVNILVGFQPTGFVVGGFDPVGWVEFNIKPNARMGC